MWIVAIGWSYVVILMAATETSFIAGLMTFLLYCMIPLSILFYITGGKRRQAHRALRAATVARQAAEASAADGAAVAENAQATTDDATKAKKY
ncbi:MULTISPECIES: hypothetical protein [unclassified Massilia]|uniref:hypothetical protein n=1 Tax=unclassified Massilia TaxID=2609279 RepID=UPI0017869E77|nr:MULTISPECIES: hypothetical protein [unclassified Massilia]MBD8529484.1 hypothetical protein [Massilia sp. CFBP 13647]MBD8672877.1 hypothetical protein [Massilia sp. CFBP 13721]